VTLLIARHPGVSPSQHAQGVIARVLLPAATTMLRHDLRFAIRLHARRPLLAGLIILTLGLAIGATTAIFSVAYPVVLKPLPLREPGRLMQIFEAYPKGSRYTWGSSQSFISVRPGTFSDWVTQSESFESIAASMWQMVVVGGGADAESVDSQNVTDGFFATLGVPPLLGRTLLADDFRDEGRRVVVISEGLWQQRFGADPRVVERTVTLDGASHEIVGVMPRGFYPTPYAMPKLWRPLVLGPDLRGSRVRWGMIPIARLKPHVTLDQAQRELDLISDRLTAAYPDHYDNMCAVVVPMNGYIYGRYERFFFLLLGAVGLVLVIACANIASLLLARATERTREFGLRSALGAPRERLVRQLLVESAVLAGLGALVGIVVAWTSLPAVLRLLPPAGRVPRLDEVRVDGAVLLFTLAVTAVTTSIVGLMPAWRLARVDVIDTLKDAARGSSMSARSARSGQVLVVIEVALTFVLLVGAALLAQSLRTLLRVDPGVDTSKVLAMSLILPPHAYGAYDLGGPNPARVRLFADLEREMRTLPGASSAALTTSLPLRHGVNPWSMHIEGRPAPPPNASAYGGAQRVKKTGLYNHGDVSIQRVTARYFETFNIPLIRGRLFDDHDAGDRPAVALINATAARRYFAGEDPIGKTIVIDMTSYFPRLTIVGIVGDSRMNGLDREVFPEVFWSMAQRPSANAWLAIRTTGDPATIASNARAVLHRLAPEIAIDQTATMGTVLAESVWQPRLAAVLVGAFGVLAVLLAAAGIYGVFSQLVSRRTPEFGVRLALGARPTQVAGLIFRRTLLLVSCGIATGLIATQWLMRLLAGQLQGVTASDPLTLAGVAAFVLAIALLASAVPSVRAARLDPLRALGHS
jgi:putative ABC transport system permease protein